MSDVNEGGLRVGSFHSVLSGVARALQDTEGEALPKAPTKEKGALDGMNVWEKTEKGNYYPIGSTIPSLPSRRFSLGWSQNQGFYLGSVKSVNDKLYPSSMVGTITAEIDKFWSKRERYQQLGLLWRRNYLLFGPPGTGKTLILEAISRLFIEKGGIVANYHGNLPCGLGGALQIIRGIEPNRPVLVLVEDLDQMIHTIGGVEQDMLQFLDGASKSENVVTIATTNYPGKLGERLLRPGRFDLLISVPEPDKDTKVGYLRAFDPEYFTDERMEQWLDHTAGLTFAELKEVVLRVLVYDIPVEQAAKSMRPESRKVDTTREITKSFAAQLGNYA